MRHSLVLTGLMLTAGAAPAQTRDVGLLLGLATVSEYDSVPQVLTTHWVTWSGGEGRLVRSIPGLVAPRADGFWRALITRDCFLPETFTPEDIEKIHCVDTLWTGPAVEPLPPLNTDWMTPCSAEYVELRFASPAVLSQSSRLWESDCAARGFSDTYRQWVRGWDGDSAVRFGALGAGAGRAYAEAAGRAMNVGTPYDEPQPQDSTCMADPEGQDGWRIERDGAVWRAVLFQQQGSELCLPEGPIAWRLPDSVVGYPEPPIPWAAVRSAVPDTAQVFAAPGGGLLLVAAPDRNRLLDASGSGARPSLDLPAGKVVMVQWATGGAVARWTRMLAGVD
jgi:hypothetical protein